MNIRFIYVSFIVILLRHRSLVSVTEERSQAWQRQQKTSQNEEMNLVSKILLMPCGFAQCAGCSDKTLKNITKTDVPDIVTRSSQNIITTGVAM